MLIFNILLFTRFIVKADIPEEWVGSFAIIFIENGKNNITSKCQVVKQSSSSLLEEFRTKIKINIETTQKNCQHIDIDRIYINSPF